MEELGFSKAEFRSAFSKTGKVYKSKRDYDTSKDKFEGKFYISYYDRVKRLTYYLRNDKLIEKMYKSKIEGSTYEKTELPISVDYNQSLLQEKDLSMTNTPYEQIVEEFSRICTHLPAIKCFGHRRKQALDKLWQMVEGKLETIKEVFHTVQVSDFLSGRIVGKMWRATFDWIIRCLNKWNRNT